VSSITQQWRKSDQWTSVRAVGSFVPQLTKKAFQKFGFSAATMLTNWAEIVGGETAAYTRPERLKWPRNIEIYGDSSGDTDGHSGVRQCRSGATLVLRVEPARALDVQYQGRQLMDRINAYFGYRAISEIRILQAPIASSLPKSSTKPERPVQPICDKPATNLPSDMTAAKSATGSDKLAAALSRLESNIRNTATAKR